jgi:hypothetical protein
VVKVYSKTFEKYDRQKDQMYTTRWNNFEKFADVIPLFIYKYIFKNRIKFPALSVPFFFSQFHWKQHEYRICFLVLFISVEYVRCNLTH